MPSEPAPLPEDRPRAGTVRSRLMLEAASELVGLRDWDHRQAHVLLRDQGDNPWEVRLLASDGPDAAAEVLEAPGTFAILNPATAVGAARQRLTDDSEAFAAIASVPSYDQMGFAVTADLGIDHLEELAALQPPLRLSLRAQRNHSVQMVVEDTLAAAGIALDDIRSWGGTVRYDEDIPHRGTRREVMHSGDVDAVFDEGIYNWTQDAADAGLRFVGLRPATMERLIAKGYRPAVLSRDRYPGLHADVDTVDFSGFLIYTRRDTADRLVTAFCSALESRRTSIPWQGGPELPLERMCVDAVDAPVPVPLHGAAATFWRDRGYLDH